MEGKQRHILVVEDDEDTSRLVAKWLERENYRVFQAFDGMQAIDAYQASSPDLVILDIMIPKLDGYEVCRRIKQDQGPDNFCPVIFLTAKGDLETKVKGLTLGADDYLSKPFNHRELMARVASLLRVKQLQEELSRRKEEVEEAHRKLDEGFGDSIKVFIGLIELHDTELGGQAKRMAQHSRNIAQGLELGEDEVRDVERAALLCDIGLVGIAPGLAYRPETEISTSEVALVRHHPALGQEILRPISNLNRVGTLIRSHHENYDGSGYPDRLLGEDIPLGARIISVAYNYDRKLHDGQSLLDAPDDDREKAAQVHLIESRGRYYDPDVVNTFLGQLDQKDRGEVHERAIPLRQLKEDMVISQDIRSRDGRLILAKGMVLKQAFIEKIWNHHRISPIVDRIYIFSGGD